MKPGKYRVVYQVTFECDVELKAGHDWGDTLSNIDIPEGGSNGSVYCENTFEITDHVHKDDND